MRAMGIKGDRPRSVGANPIGAVAHALGDASIAQSEFPFRAEHEFLNFRLFFGRPANFRKAAECTKRAIVRTIGTMSTPLS